MSTSRDILVAALTADDELDDIGRARIWARLEDRIADEPAVAPRRSWRPLALVAAGAGIAALVIVFARTPGREPGKTLVAPKDATLTTQLGPHTRAALVGPAELRIVGEPSDATTVALDRGTLLADFAGGPGRSLEVVAPGLRATVVGTLFSIEVRDAASSCVAVAHGRVRVAIGARVAFVATGEQLCSADVAPSAIEPRVRDQLARHERIIADTSVPAPAPTAVSVPTSPAPTPTVASTPTPVAPTSTATPASSPAPTPKPAPAIAFAPAPHPASKPRRTHSPATAVQHAPAAIAEPTSEHQPPSQPSAQPSPAQPSPAQPSSAQPAPAQQAPTPTAQPPPPPAQVAKSVATPPAQPAKPTPPTAQELYRTAEAALAHRDPAAADRALAMLVATEPSSPLVPQAQFDRARIAYDRKDWSAARARLDALAATNDAALAESGRYLACRIAVESRDGTATRCLRAFRTAFPKSPHDRDVLGALAQLAHADGGCSAARPYVEALVRDYPHSTLAAGWRDTCPEGK